MAAVRSLNPGQPLTRFRPIGDIVEHSVSPRRFFAELVSVFAAFGLVLASLGIYGVVSYTVAQQTQDIGIRMALGATPSRVLADVVGTSARDSTRRHRRGRRPFRPAMGKLMASLLFATPPVDPVTFAGTVSLLVVVAGIAAFIPRAQGLEHQPDHRHPRKVTGLGRAAPPFGLLSSYSRRLAAMAANTWSRFRSGRGSGTAWPDGSRGVSASGKRTLNEASPGRGGDVAARVGGGFGALAMASRTLRRSHQPECGGQAGLIAKASVYLAPPLASPAARDRPR